METMAAVVEVNVQTPRRPPDKRVHSRMSGMFYCHHIKVWILLSGLTMATVTYPAAASLTTGPSTTPPSQPSSRKPFHPDHDMARGRSPASDTRALFLAELKQNPDQTSTSSDIPGGAASSGNTVQSSSSSSPPEDTTQDGRDTAKSARRVDFNLMSLEKKKLILSTLETMFLKNAGMTKRPQISKDHAVSDYMLDLYQAKLQGGKDDSPLQVRGNGMITANTVRSFLHTDLPIRSCQPPLCARLWFDVSSVTHGEKLAAADLRVFVDTSSLVQNTPHRPAQDGAVAARSPQSPPHRLQVYEIMRPPGDHEVISRMLDTRVLEASRNGSWVSFDLLPAVVRWRRGLNHGLELRLVAKRPSLSTDHHVRLRRSASLTTREWALQRPLMVLFTNDELSESSKQSQSSSSSQTKLYRRKRSNKSKESKDKTKNNKRKNRRRRRKNKKRRKKKRRRKKKGNKDHCQRHALYVDFTEVGWTDWIVAPKGYRADYCSGQCMAPMPFFFKASNHAMLQARVYKVNPSAVPMVCCVPVEMLPITMLYRDENGSIVMKNYEDMRVTECGCK